MADLYLIVNFFFVFASLIEFALVSYEPPVKSQNARKTIDFAKSIFKTRQSNNMQNDNANLKNGDFKVTLPSKISQQETSFLAKSITSNDSSSSLGVISNKTVNQSAISNSPKQKLKTLRLQDNPIEYVVDMHDFSQTRNRGAKKMKRVSSTINAHGGFHEDRVSGGRKKLCGIINLDSFSKDNADEVSKWLFPLAFTIWNLVYFVLGMTVAKRWHFYFLN